jgi:hypothetical protein
MLDRILLVQGMEAYPKVGVCLEMKECGADPAERVADSKKLTVPAILKISRKSYITKQSVLPHDDCSLACDNTSEPSSS